VTKLQIVLGVCYFFVFKSKKNHEFGDLLYKKIYVKVLSERRINMLNQVVLVGRLVQDPELKESENKRKTLQLTIAVPRSFKNVNGEYETDFIKCIMWNNVASNTATYCKKGDILGIKGRIQVSMYEKDDERKYVTEVIAEKVTFLTNKKADG